jgi:hypothetical protein
MGCARKASDEKIAQDIQAKSLPIRRRKESQVEVEAQEGKVTLKGTTKTQTNRQKIEQIAKEEPGGRGRRDLRRDRRDSSGGEPNSSSAVEQAPRVPVPPPPSPKPVVPAGTVVTIRSARRHRNGERCEEGRALQTRSSSVSHWIQSR